MTKEYSVDSQLELGYALARLYIVANGISPIASNTAKELMEKGTFLVRTGFEEELRKSNFQIRGFSIHQPLFG